MLPESEIPKATMRLGVNEPLLFRDWSELTAQSISPSKDILSRWTFPLVPDDNYPGGSRYEHTRGNRYLPKDNSTILARYILFPSRHYATGLTFTCLQNEQNRNQHPRRCFHRNMRQRPNQRLSHWTQLYDWAQLHHRELVHL